MLFVARSPAFFFDTIIGFLIRILILRLVLWASAVRLISIRARRIVPIDAQVIWMIFFFFEAYLGDFGVRLLRYG